MVFNPVDFYYFADWLYTQQNQHSEARARAIISKAYYGAFLEARNKAGITDKSSGIHKKVRDHYFNNGHSAIANRLDDSRIKRNGADYDTALAISSRDSGMALKLAKKILEEIGVTP